MKDTCHRLAAMGLAAALAVVVVGAQTVPALDVKPGLWESTTVSSMSTGGASSMDTSKMTPAQKAKMDAAMKAMNAQHTDVHTRCITREQMAKDFLPPADRSCKETVTTNSATVLDVTRVCTGSRSETSEAHMEAQSRERLTGTVRSSMTQAGQTQQMTITFTSKWLAADCGKDR